MGPTGTTNRSHLTSLYRQESQIYRTNHQTLIRRTSPLVKKPTLHRTSWTIIFCLLYGQREKFQNLWSRQTCNTSMAYQTCPSLWRPSSYQARISTTILNLTTNFKSSAHRLGLPIPSLKS